MGRERNEDPKIKKKFIVDVGGFITFRFVTFHMSLIWTKTGENRRSLNWRGA